MFFLGMVICGSGLARKERAAFIAANLEAPDEEDLLTYISASLFGDETVKSQAAPIVCDLLGRLSADKLAHILDDTWYRLCPLPLISRSGYAEEENVARKDQVLVAAFSAIMRMKRMRSLPTIERWIEHPKTNCHSAAWLRALHACHATLRNHQDSLSPSNTLLRPASAEAATPDLLLRPVTGMPVSGTETGEQLLRASAGEGPGASIE